MMESMENLLIDRMNFVKDILLEENLLVIFQSPINL